MSDGSAPSGALTVGTLNIWGRWANWPSRLETLARTYPSPGPDVLMLQEVRDDALGDQAEEIARALAYPHWETVEGHRADDGAEGLAMLSRFRLDNAHTEPLPASDPHRRVLVAHVLLGAATVSLVCGHTVAVPDDARRDQIEALLARRDDRLILGADLNDTPHALAESIAAAGLHDSLAGDLTPTWPMCRMTFGSAWESQLLRAPHFSLAPRRLDYLLSRGVVALSAQVDQLHDGERHASDHALLWGRFRIAT